MEVISIILVTVAAFFILHYLNTWMNNKNTNFPPGPRILPLIGNLHSVLFKGLHQTLLELSKTYGSVFSIQMGMKKMVVLAGYDAVKDALVNHAEEFEERARVPIFEKMDKGMGLSFSHGENWKIMRRFTISTLRDFGMGKTSLEEKIAEECSHLIQRVQSFKSMPFDNSRHICSAVANIIVSILLGNRMEYEDPHFKRLLDLIYENIKIMGQRMVLEKSYPQSYFHNDNLTGLIRSLINAGTDTTSASLRWCLLMMIKYPHYQEKVQDEITKVIGLAQPTYSHRLQMPFTNAVIHETQRISNIVPMSLPHETTRDVNFRGYNLPKGTHIIPLLTSVLHDKKQFKTPEVFDPNNFLDSEEQFMTNDAFMAFSAGRRVCVGEKLARMELFIFFTSLLQKFLFCLPPGVSEVDLTPAVGFTRSPIPHKMCAIPRIQ
ncbi:cytochrome P450 2K1-like isoform X3 [Rhinoderma darwinii]|uniref:cytochrome P450 2K1-like isoform X3 n=1 Tax=Rhinoderma darwinii TaxID=43563 RepID=UPI003F67B5D8